MVTKRYEQTGAQNAEPTSELLDRIDTRPLNGGDR